MAQNTAPIYTLVPKVNWGSTVITAANTAKDGTGTVTTIFTAGVNGSFVSRVRFVAAGTNVATVARVFLNNGSTNATAANNIYLDNITLPATTLSEVAGQNVYEIPLNIAIPAGYVLNVVLGTAISAGVYSHVIGGDY
jgi:hypothetical protein